MSSFLPHRKHYGLAFLYSVDPGNGGAATTVAAVFPDDKYDALATEPTWAHHRFIGWFDQAGTPDAAGTTIGNAVLAADDASPERPEVYGQWQLPTTVVFDAATGGGSMDPWSADYYEGQPFGELPVAVKEGLTFSGWYLNGTRVTSESVVPAGGGTLVAQFVSIQKVEYVSFSSSVANGEDPALPVGVVPGTGTAVEIDWAVSSYTGDTHFGNRFNTNATDFRLFWYNSSTMYYDRGSGRIQLNPRTSLNSRFRVKIGNYYVTNLTNGYTTSGSAASYSPPNQSSLGFFGYAKIYGCKVWDGETLVRDMYPARRGDVGGLFDTVSGTFFPVADGVSHTLGPDVSEGGS